MTTPRLITVDGPAGAGKGTLARRLAAHFGFAHLDTGKLYRAVGLGTLAAGGDPAEPGDAIAAARALDPASIARGGLENPELAGDTAASAASKVAAIPEVREVLLSFQRDFAQTPPDDSKGAVLDGRDIGTVICPQAEIKLFVTASDEVRAARRFAEISQKNETATLALVLEDLRQRDQRDRDRATAPMIQAQDSILLDTSDLDASQALAKAIAIVALHPGLLT